MQIKKWHLWLLVAFMFIAQTVQAEEIALPPVEAKNIIHNDSITGLVKSSDNANKGALDTDDVVIIHEDGSLEVGVNNINMLVLPPFGCVAFTQDVLAQLDLYLSMTDDIESLVTALKESGIHIYVYDSISEASAAFIVEQDALSKLFVNAVDIAEGSRKFVANTLESMYGMDTVECLELGDNFFFKMSNKTDPSSIIYTTYVGGQTIDIYCSSGDTGFTDYDIEMFELMLTDLVVTTR